MENARNTFDLVLKAVALAMGIASIVLGILNAVDPGMQVTLLSIGLVALALAALQNDKDAGQKVRR